MINSLIKQYNQSFSTKRLQFVTEPSEESPGFIVTNRKDYVNYLQDEVCLFQPLDAEFSMDVEGGFGKDYMMMCDVLDIVDGDRIIIDGQEYRIVGIEKHNWMNHEHMEIIIRIFKS